MADAPTDHDDASLMARVAEARDADAFAEFMRRHQAAAFNLACYLTRNRDEAEEVLQDALLRIWRHAGDFSAEGSARNWLLKIVAHETFRQRARNRSSEEKKVRAQNRGPLRTVGSPDQYAEKDELLGALRLHLQDLPEEERRAVALYYGAGCTQAEISKALDCSQNKISYILNQALGKLRARLTEAGYAAALPLLAEDGLRSAICCGGEAPAGVTNAVLRSLKAGVAEHSRRVVAAKGGFGTVVFVVAALVLATAGAWWLLRGVPAAPMTTDAQPTPTETFEPEVKSGSSNVEILYEDAFDGEDLDPFWETIEPPAQDGYFRCWVKQGSLVIFAGTKEARTDLSAARPNNPSDNLRVFPEVSLTTKAVTMDGAAIFCQLTCKALKMNKGYELHLDVLDREGRKLGGTAQILESENKKEPSIHRYLGGTENAGPSYAAQVAPLAPAAEADVVGLLVNPEGRIGELDREGRLFYYEGTPRAVSEIRLRLTAKVLGTEAYAMWIIGQARVARVRDWEDPQVLPALDRRPWSSEKK